MTTGVGNDDGSREFAVRELGEEAVREAEVRAMGIPAASIREGLGLDAEGPVSRPGLRSAVGREEQCPEERASFAPAAPAVPGGASR